MKLSALFHALPIICLPHLSIKEPYNRILHLLRQPFPPFVSFQIKKIRLFSGEKKFHFQEQESGILSLIRSNKHGWVLFNKQDLVWRKWNGFKKITLSKSSIVIQMLCGNKRLHSIESSFVFEIRVNNPSERNH